LSAAVLFSLNAMLDFDLLRESLVSWQGVSYSKDCHDAIKQNGIWSSEIEDSD
jgi:hypothetical protein